MLNQHRGDLTIPCLKFEIQYLLRRLIKALKSDQNKSIFKPF